MEKKAIFSLSESRFMRFLGGNDLIYALIALVLLGIVIFIFDKISYVFQPFIIVFNTIAAPIIVSLVLFYLFNPIVNMMERYRIPRLLGITIIYVAIVGIITLIVNLLIPIIGSQIESFIKNTPNYLHKITRSLDKLNNNTILSGYMGQVNEWLESAQKRYHLWFQITQTDLDLNSQLLLRQSQISVLLLGLHLLCYSLC